MKVHKILLLILLFTGAVSCKKSFLSEKPLDFLSTSNAFQTEADFNASVNNLYGLVRQHFYTINDFQPFYYQYRTDAFFDIISNNTQHTGGYGSPWAYKFCLGSEL